MLPTCTSINVNPEECGAHSLRPRSPGGSSGLFYSKWIPPSNPPPEPVKEQPKDEEKTQTSD